MQYRPHDHRRVDGYKVKANFVLVLLHECPCRLLSESFAGAILVSRARIFPLRLYLFQCDRGPIILGEDWRVGENVEHCGNGRRDNDALDRASVFQRALKNTTGACNCGFDELVGIDRLEVEWRSSVLYRVDALDRFVECVSLSNTSVP